MNDPIDRVVNAAAREWRRLHIRPVDIACLSADLRDDLTAAAAEGAGPEDLIGGDPRAFARGLADEARVDRIPYAFDRLLLTALVGALPGLAAAVVASRRWALREPTPTRRPATQA